jgi:hypothetical protein
MKIIAKPVLDADLAKVGAALRRAAKQARKTAEKTHTPLIIYERGHVTHKMLVRKTSRQVKEEHVKSPWPTSSSNATCDFRVLPPHGTFLLNQYNMLKKRC